MRLVWNERKYHTGLDRGVLYIEDGPIVPWNGLTSMTEGHSGGDVQPYYLDGVKYIDFVENEDFAGTLEALYYPPEFEACEGTIQVALGLSAAGQQRKRFNLAYRTLVGDGVDDTEHYKLHLLYRCTATTSDKAYKTLGETTEPSSFQWSLTTVPEVLDGFKPTAHLILDSVDVDLSGLEDILYGTDDEDPAWPTMAEVVSYVVDASGPGPGTYTVDVGAIIVSSDMGIGGGSGAWTNPDTGTYSGSIPNSNIDTSDFFVHVKYGEGPKLLNWDLPAGGTVDSIEYVTKAYRESDITPGPGFPPSWATPPPSTVPWLSVESFDRDELLAFPTLAVTTWFSDPDNPVVEKTVSEPNIDAVMIDDHPMHLVTARQWNTGLTANINVAYLACRITYTVA